jgi:hypothetical protein
MTRPRLNDAVHWVSLGTARGEYPSRCFAADVVDTDPADPNTVGLFVKKAWAVELRPDVHYAEGVAHPHITASSLHTCGGRDYPTGTWHWAHD